MRLLILLLGLCCGPVVAQEAARNGGLTRALEGAAESAIARFEAGGLGRDKLAITVIDMRGGAHSAKASYRGDAPFYPASVVKLFYLVMAQAQMEAGKLAATAELDRAMHDMIVDSVNEATGLVLDSITGTTSGPELATDAFGPWMEKRNAVNRYFSALGYKDINVNQKTYSEGPYGRERQARGPHFENNNRLTTDAVARLVYEIATKKVVTPERCAAMMALMNRDFSGPATNPDDQAHGFSGPALPAGARYYSKAGWTSTARHDATFIELPNGAKYVAVIFTVDNAKRAEIIPFVAKRLVDYFGQ